MTSERRLPATCAIPGHEPMMLDELQKSLPVKLPGDLLTMSCGLRAAAASGHKARGDRVPESGQVADPAQGTEGDSLFLHVLKASRS